MAVHGTVIKEEIVDAIVNRLEVGSELPCGCTIERVAKSGQTMMRVKIKTPSDSDRWFLLRMLEEI